MSRKTLIETSGWLGVCLILTAYTLVSFSIIVAGSFLYFILNVLGGVGMIVSAYPKKAYQPIVLNTIWISIACLAFWQIF